MERERLMRLSTALAMVSAAVLVVIKGFVYFDSKSVAMLSSLADSTIDLLASAVTLFAVRYALTPADSDHRFGHGKAEPLSGLAQAAFVGGSAILVMIEAVSRFHEPVAVNDSTPGIIVMMISMAVTLGLVSFQRFVINRTGSVAISADSLHYTGDLLMNGSVIVALVLSSRFALSWIDPVFGIAISLFMLINAVRIIRQSVNSLMDRELPEEERQAILAIAKQHPKVKQVHDLRTRTSGLQKFIQMHIVLSSALTLREAHFVADDIEKAVESAFPGADIIIHEDPEEVLAYQVDKIAP